MTTKIIYRRRFLAETKLINRIVKGKLIGYWEEYYYDNGNLYSKGNYNNKGKRIGYWEYYYPNGNLYYKGNYNNDGQQIGEWEYYCEKSCSLK